MRGAEFMVPATHHRSVDAQAIVVEQLQRHGRRGRRGAWSATRRRRGVVRRPRVSDHGQRQTAVRVPPSAGRRSRCSLRRRRDDHGQYGRDRQQ